MLLGFRKTKGPDPAEYAELFDGASMSDDFGRELSELESRGLITLQLSLTRKGLDFENEIFLLFV